MRQKKATGGCHGSCEGDGADMRVEIKESAVMCVLLRCLCLALVDTIVRGGHVNVWYCVIARTHTHVCCRSIRGHAWSCGDSLIVLEQLPACCQELFRLASLGGYVGYVVMRLHVRVWVCCTCDSVVIVCQWMVSRTHVCCRAEESVQHVVLRVNDCTHMCSSQTWSP